MRIFAIDDEDAMLEELHDAIVEAVPDAEVLDFMRGTPAIEAASAGPAPDVVFCDIELPGMNGMALASRMREVAPNAKIVFVTAYPTYAVEAFRIHANGFVVKPVEAARVREELDVLFGAEGDAAVAGAAAGAAGAVVPGEPTAAADAGAEPEAVASGKLRVRCFGQFEVFWQNEPLVFSRTRSKELFAFLVDREGSSCTAGQIVDALWNDGNSAKKHGSYLRVITRDLRASLASVGMEDVLVRRHNQWAVRTELLDCDFYQLLSGDAEAAREWDGRYMQQYSWAEPTLGRLQFRQRHGPASLD